MMNNPDIKILKTEILSDHWYTLKKVTFEQRNKHHEWELVVREAYDRGNGAAILLYNPASQSIILTKQFRMPSYINGNEDGMMIEVCAGLLDDLQPEVCIRKETEEETGYRVNAVTKVMEAYMSPGSVTEKLHFFLAQYEQTMKVSEGGGLDDDHENIDVIEIKFDKAIAMVASGAIQDAKTILLIQYLQINHNLWTI